MTKSQYMAELASNNDMTKAAIEGVFATIEKIVRRELLSKGEISPLPGLVVFRKATKKATAARMGRNPQTGEAIQISAKPSKTVIKASLRKCLKDMVK